MRPGAPGLHARYCRRAPPFLSSLKSGAAGQQPCAPPRRRITAPVLAMHASTTAPASLPAARNSSSVCCRNGKLAVREKRGVLSLCFERGEIWLRQRLDLPRQALRQVPMLGCCPMGGLCEHDPAEERSCGGTAALHVGARSCPHSDATAPGGFPASQALAHPPEAGLAEAAGKRPGGGGPELGGEQGAAPGAGAVLHALLKELRARRARGARIILNLSYAPYCTLQKGAWGAWLNLASSLRHSVWKRAKTQCREGRLKAQPCVRSAEGWLGSLWARGGGAELGSAAHCPCQVPASHPPASSSAGRGQDSRTTSAMKQGAAVLMSRKCHPQRRQGSSPLPRL